MLALPAFLIMFARLNSCVFSLFIILNSFMSLVFCCCSFILLLNSLKLILFFIASSASFCLPKISASSIISLVSSFFSALSSIFSSAFCVSCSCAFGFSCSFAKFATFAFGSAPCHTALSSFITPFFISKCSMPSIGSHSFSS